MVGEVDNTKEIAQVLNYKVGTVFTTYMELPLGASDFLVRNAVITGVKKQLVGWKKRYFLEGEGSIDQKHPFLAYLHISCYYCRLLVKWLKVG